MLKPRVVIAAAAWILSGSLVRPGPAWADFKVWTPDVNQGELAIESVGDAGFDANHAKNGERSNTAEVEYGLTPRLQTELEFEANRNPGTGQANYLDQITSENLFQFTERGEYWLDAGFFFEYGQGVKIGNVNETTFGPVLRKEFWGLSNTVNLFIEKDIGRNASGRPAFVYAWETRVDAWTVQFGRRFAVEPGFQVYGQPGQFGHFAKAGAQDHRGGPQLFGKIFDFGPGSIEWNGGVLFGLTPAAPRTTLRWQAEYEIRY